MLGKHIQFSISGAAFLGISAVCFAYLLQAAWPFTVDDAFITLRYSSNLAEGFGPTFNPGLPPCEGYTTFLWMVLMAVPHLLKVDVILFSKVMGVACTITYTVLVFLLLKHLERNESREAALSVPCIGVLLISSCPATAIHAVSGMETALATMWITAFVHLGVIHVESPRSRTAILLSLIALLAGLTRPEFSPVILVGLIVVMAMLSGVHRTVLMKVTLLLYVVPGIIYFAWRFSYYHLLFPLPFYVKVASQSPPNGWKDLLSFSRYMGVHLGIPALIGLVWYRKRLRPALALAASLAFLLLFPRHIMGYQWRYLFPLAPLLIVLGALGIGVIRKWIRTWNYQPLAVSSAATVGITLVVWLGLLTEPPRMIDERRVYAAGLQTAHVTLGERLASLQALTRNPRLAIGDAGAVPYYSRWETIDTYGLNDAHLARAADPDPDPPPIRLTPDKRGLILREEVVEDGNETAVHGGV